MDTKRFLGPNDKLIGIYLSQLGVGTPNDLHLPSSRSYSLLVAYRYSFAESVLTIIIITKKVIIFI